MSKIKKIIGVIVITMFLSALSVNFGLIQVAKADVDPECPGWNGQPFCGWTGAYPNPCQIVDFCTSTCLDC